MFERQGVSPTSLVVGVPLLIRLGDRLWYRIGSCVVVFSVSSGVTLFWCGDLPAIQFSFEISVVTGLDSLDTLELVSIVFVMVSQA